MSPEDSSTTRTPSRRRTSQRQPQLRGLKTLLDLETRGFGANATAGLLYRPHRSVQLGLSYTSPTHVHTEGEATGNVGAQLATLGLALRPDFRYDAEVDTHFPQMVAAGLSWDDPVPLEVVERLLSGDGHTVSTATNGLEALEKFQVGWFDVVVTDHAMPKMSGAELAAMIKRLAPRKPVTLLALREALSTVK